MELKDIGWELFAKTGEVDAYLLYKTGGLTGTESGFNGKREDERLDNKERGLR